MYFEMFLPVFYFIMVYSNMLHVGAAGVFMLQSFGSIRLTALTHRDAMFPSVQPPLFLFFNPA